MGHVGGLMALVPYSINGAMSVPTPPTSAQAVAPSAAAFDSSTKMSAVAWVRFDIQTERADIVTRWDGVKGKSWSFGGHHSKLTIDITDADWVYTTPFPMNGNAEVNGNMTNGSAVVTAVTTTAGLAVGMPVSALLSGVYCTSNGTTILSVDSATQFTMSAAATATATAALIFGNDGRSQYGKWSHVGYVYDGTLTLANRCKMFWNGQGMALTMVGTIPATLTATTADISILALNSAAIAHLALYPGVALTADQIAQDARWVRDTTGLEAWWPGNDGSGSTLTDISGNAHHATLSGGATWSGALAGPPVYRRRGAFR